MHHHYNNDKELKDNEVEGNRLRPTN
jgi:hypothetical protein